MKISKVDSSQVAVQFQRIRGTKIDFMKYFKIYTEKILNDFIDTNINSKAEETKVEVEEGQIGTN
jgi:hypothetical protein